MKTEIFVALEYGSLEQGYYGSDWVQHSLGYVFDDYEKARYWVLAWVRTHNNTWRVTKRDEISGEIVSVDEPVMKETAKDIWESFSADIQIFRIGEIDMDGFNVTEKICLS